MDRYLVENLFGIEGLNVAWYGCIIGIGLVLGMLIAMRRATEKGYKSEMLIDFLLYAIPIAVVCARLYYVVFEWDYYSQHLNKIIAINEGGIAIYGAVLGGIATAFVFCKIKKVSFIRLLDIVIPGLVIGQAIGRWGNFVNQEAFGEMITNPNLQFFPLGVYIERLGEWHQATFFYESSWNFVLLILMLVVSRKTTKDGMMIGMYFTIYGLGRFLIEGLRTDSLYMFAGIRVSQMLSLVLIAIGIIIFILIKNDKLQVNNSLRGYIIADMKEDDNSQSEIELNDDENKVGDKE